jgi:hypothetical protein
MTDLSTAVVSITPTARGRFFWAAWWTGAPSYAPFRKPDASNGGARTEAAALAEAERVAGRHLTMTEPYWARAFNRTLRGEAPPAPPQKRAPKPERPVNAKPKSAWETLGLAPGATVAEIKRAYRQRALDAHPDRGGDPAVFRALTRAYEKALSRPKRR